jgi:hypothetical protein
MWLPTILVRSEYSLKSPSSPLHFDFEDFPKALDLVIDWSETTLNYWMMMERYPNLKEEVGGLIPGFEISSLLDKTLARWSTASCALALASRPSVSKKKKI